MCDAWEFVIVLVLGVVHKPTNHKQQRRPEFNGLDQACQSDFLWHRARRVANLEAVRIEAKHDDLASAPVPRVGAREDVEVSQWVATAAAVWVWVLIDLQ